MSRREKFDAARKEVFLDLLRKGIRRTNACKKVGIHRDTFNAHVNKNPKFAEAVMQAEMDANELVEQALFNNALKGNVTAQQVWLYNRDPERWADKRNLELTGKNGGAIKTESIVGLVMEADELLQERTRQRLENKLSAKQSE